MNRSLVLATGFLALIVGFVALTGTRGLAQRPGPAPSPDLQPFQISLTVPLPDNDPNGMGEASFAVPAGKRLNLRFLTYQSQPHVGRIEGQIVTSVGGNTVAHFFGGGSSGWERPLDLLSDDTGPVTVRVVLNTSNVSGYVYTVTLSGVLF